MAQTDLEARFASLLQSTSGDTPPLDTGTTHSAPFALDETEQMSSLEETKVIDDGGGISPLIADDPALAAAHAQARRILRDARAPQQSGWLLKKAPQGDPQRRWCALRHQILLYYVSKPPSNTNLSNQDPKGALPLHGSIIQKNITLASGTKKKNTSMFGSLRNLLSTNILTDHRLRLTLSGGTTFEWSTDTEQIRDEWYDAFVKYGQCTPNEPYQIGGGDAPLTAPVAFKAKSTEDLTSLTSPPAPLLPTLLAPSKSEMETSTSNHVGKSGGGGGRASHKRTRSMVEINDGGWVEVEGTAAPSVPSRPAASLSPARAPASAPASAPARAPAIEKGEEKNESSLKSSTLLRAASVSRKRQKKRIQATTPRPELVSGLVRGLPNMSGYLQKRGGRSFGISSLQSWNQRYFRLVGPILVYTEKFEDMTPKDTYLFHRDVIVQNKKEEVEALTSSSASSTSVEDMDDALRTIELVNLPTTGTKLTLVANSASDRRKWYSAFTSIVELLNSTNRVGPGEASVEEEKNRIILMKRKAETSELYQANKSQRDLLDATTAAAAPAAASSKSNGGITSELGWMDLDIDGTMKHPSSSPSSSTSSSFNPSSSTSSSFASSSSRHYLMSALAPKTGWLQKKGGASMGIAALQTWKDRWFQLLGPFLSYTMTNVVGKEGGGGGGGGGGRGSSSSSVASKNTWNLTNATVEIGDTKHPSTEAKGEAKGEAAAAASSVMLTIRLDVSIVSNVSAAAPGGVLHLRVSSKGGHDGMTSQQTLDLAASWKAAIDSNVKACASGRYTTSKHWLETRSSRVWLERSEERNVVDHHVLGYTDLRREEYQRLVAENEEEILLASGSGGGSSNGAGVPNGVPSGVLRVRRVVPKIPPSPSRAPPTPGKLITRKPSILSESSDDEDEDITENGEQHINATTPELSFVMELVSKRKGVTGIEFFDMMWQRKKDANMIYRQRRMVVITKTHLLTYRKRKTSMFGAPFSSSKSKVGADAEAKLWTRSKTIKLKNVYRFSHLNVGAPQTDLSESVNMRTKKGITYTFVGNKCTMLSMAIQRSTGMIHRHPGNVYRCREYKEKTADTAAKGASKISDDEENVAGGSGGEGDDGGEEDMGTVSDSYTGAQSENEEDEDEDEGANNNQGGKKVSSVPTVPPAERHVVDCLGALASAAKLKAVGEIQFCALVLQDKGQGWKQRRVVIFTTERLLTFKVKSSSSTVKLSKNIPVSSIGEIKKKESVGKDRGEGMLIKLDTGRTTLDFEGRGCHALLLAVNTVLGRN